MQNNRSLIAHSKKTLVIKYGGNAMISPKLQAAVVEDILKLSADEFHIVVVHGGGPEISQGLALIGKESRFIDGIRVSDQHTIDVVTQVLAGKINKNLTALFNGNAIGLSGVDGNLIQCRKKNYHTDLGFVGEITHIRTALLTSLLNAGFIPVIAGIGLGEDRKIYNINADIAATKIAIALNAYQLIYMTDIAGLLSDVRNPQSLISTLPIDDIPKLTENGVISDGMIPKIHGCRDFVECTGHRAYIIDGRRSHAILQHIQTGNLGTTFYKKEQQ